MRPSPPIAGSVLLLLALAPAEAAPCRIPGAPQPGSVTASWYGAERHGRPTASGETFNEHLLTAAHPSLRLLSLVRVINLVNGAAVEVRITDRGPGLGRGIDLSEAAAERIGMRACGLAPVRLELVGLK